jgi:hypothetical protein
VRVHRDLLCVVWQVSVYRLSIQYFFVAPESFSRHDFNVTRLAVSRHPSTMQQAIAPVISSCNMINMFVFVIRCGSTLKIVEVCLFVYGVYCIIYYEE